MRKSYSKILPIVFGLLTWTSLSAQNLMSFEDGSGNAIANGSTVVVSGDHMAFELISDVKAALNGSTPRDINVQRYELDVLAGTQNYFCWGLCYLPQDAGTIPHWVSNDPILGMTPNTFTSDFKAYMVPQGVLGTMSFLYTWYDLNNPSDSSWLVFEFESIVVGVNENEGPVNSFNVFPNPVNGENFTVDVQLNSNLLDMAIVMHNALGEEVLRKPLKNAEVKLSIDVESIDQGIYFCSVLAGGELFSTRRVVITD